MQIIDEEKRENVIGMKERILLYIYIYVLSIDGVAAHCVDGYLDKIKKDGGEETAFGR